MVTVYQKPAIKLHLHVVKDFEERECHSTSDDHFIHLVQQILDQQNLVCHLRTVTQKKQKITF